MTMFSRRRRGAPAAVGDEGRGDAEVAAVEEAGGFPDHDTAALAAMTAQQRADQVVARRALFDYVDAMWDGAKAKGPQPRQSAGVRRRGRDARPDRRAAGHSGAGPARCR
ncbi:hypothetical protein K1W54_12490 [Micromonospora sp. CPCC 205371]|nr:hypothetical protein [Micromonospora sp. CPCC 205371]